MFYVICLFQKNTIATKMYAITSTTATTTTITTTVATIAISVTNSGVIDNMTTSTTAQ